MNRFHAKNVLAARAYLGWGVDDLCSALRSYMALAKTKGGVSYFHTDESGGMDVFINAPLFCNSYDAHINRSNTLDVVHVDARTKELVGVRFDLSTQIAEPLKFKPLALAGLTKMLYNHVSDACVDMEKIKHEAAIEKELLELPAARQIGHACLRPLTRA